MALGTPYSVCGGTAASGAGSSLQVTAGTGLGGALGTRGGDAIAVWVTGNSAAGLPQSVSDSQSNTYAQAVLDTNRAPSLGLWVALDATPLVSGTDWIKGTYSGTGGAKGLIARACSGIAQASATDGALIADAAGTSGGQPTAGPTSTLALPSEWAMAAIADGSAGGAPSSWTGGFSAVASVTPVQILTVAEQIVTSTAALTASATISNTTWVCGLVTLKAAAVPAPYLAQNSGMF